MELTQKFLEEFKNNIPEGFEMSSSKLSFEWSYFYRSIQTNRQKRYKAKCMFCGKECEGRIERLRTHFLDGNCSKIPFDILNQYKIDYVSGKNKHNEDSKFEFDNNVLNELAMKFVISANLPFRVIDNPFLKRLIDYASHNRSNCRLHSSTTMRYQYFNNFVSSIKSKNIQQLKADSNITIAMDGWTDCTGNSIYAIIALSPPIEYILSIEDLSSVQHNAQNLKQHLTSVLFENNCIDPSSLVALVTDSPNVMEKMRSDIHKDFKNIIPLKCSLHVLNLISKDIAHLENSHEIIKDNCKIINFFKSSHTMFSWIKTYQKENNIKHILQSFTESRWYSLAKLCLSIDTYKEAFQTAINTLPVTNTVISELIKDEIHFIKNRCLLDLIKPIADKISYLEKNTATLSDVIFSILDIYVKIDAISIPRTYVNLKNSALKCVFKRFLSLHKNPIYVTAFFLWPKFKRVPISEKIQILDIIKNIIELSMCWELFDKEEAKQLYRELMLYADNRNQFSHTNDELMLSPRDYWKGYSNLNNPIYKFANKLFSICPHSASVERLFSMLGLTKSKIRNRMSIKTLSKIAMARHELKGESKQETNLKIINQVENENKQESESESEDEMTIFSDDYDEIGEEFDENQSMLNIDNNNNNSNDSQQENTNIIIGAQVLDVQLGLEPVCQIYEYFNITLFKHVITENHLKTRRPTDLDTESPPRKKNNFSINDIIPCNISNSDTA